MTVKVSDRQIAIETRVNRETVAARGRFLGRQCAILLQEFGQGLVARSGRRTEIQFDEMESFEHTKCKPISIPLVVDAPTRLILGVDACSMPAKGPLALISQRKYGPRADHRPATIEKLLKQVQPALAPQAEVLTDSHPFYPGLIRRALPQASHRQILSRRAAVVGQGELKKIGRDPIFSLNHTAAMFRDGLSRLVRRTWGTTKRLDRLRDRLVIYAVRHNRRILERKGSPSGSPIHKLPSQFTLVKGF